MNTEIYRQCEKWFTEYPHQFEKNDPETLDAFHIKIYHSFQVRDVMEIIGNALNLSEYDLNLAKSIGLYHDVGRFEQFFKYHTFSDRHSIDHADLSAKITISESPLSQIASNEKKVIYTAIKYHNKNSIPIDLPADEMLFTKMIRDADKVDILRLCKPIYEAGEDVPKKLKLWFPDIPEIGDYAYTEFLKEHSIDYDGLISINDFKIAQLAWIYDLNFEISKKIFKDRGYAESILETLPKDGNGGEKRQNIANQCKKFFSFV